jgi:hypothetical protein
LSKAENYGPGRVAAIELPLRLPAKAGRTLLQ